MKYACVQQRRLFNIQLEIVVQVALDGSEVNAVGSHQLLGVLEQRPSKASLGFLVGGAVGPHRAINDSCLRMLAILAEGFRLADLLPVGIAQRQGITNPLGEHVV
ncbi:hypothetical protein D3C84_696390 [compost metagenome]